MSLALEATARKNSSVSSESKPAIETGGRSASNRQSGRPYCSFQATLPPTSIAGFDTELAEEFFRAVVNNAGFTLHLRVLEGSNAHHMIEAAFKAFARSLRQAVAVDPTEHGVPSTKGVL